MVSAMQSARNVGSVAVSHDVSYIAIDFNMAMPHCPTGHIKKPSEGGQKGEIEGCVRLLEDYSDLPTH